MNKIKNNPFLLVSSIISLIVGLWLVLTDPARIINSIYFLVGGALVITGIVKILSENRFKGSIYTYEGFLNATIGILIMFFHDTLITIILGALFVVFPLLRILQSNDKFYAFKKEIPLLIIALVIALSGDLIVKIFIVILGVLFILLAIYLFTCIFVNKINIIKFEYKRHSETKINKRDVIDVDFEEGEGNE